MGRIRHKRNHHARRDISRAARTRARKLDADQVEQNLKDAKKNNELLNPDHLDIEKPGLGLFYCVECDRHFPSHGDREVHQKSKLHKRIAKKMHEEKAYTIEESMRAAGIGIDNTQRVPKDQQQQTQSNDNQGGNENINSSSTAQAMKTDA
ncbi:uncharacterized protein FA14DRAFT_172600 [Meira miltonrushii]|uniref:C2H2-type domain-containing protein n=1 Tax=Meira miltonrushii TaxID=1280837 RepID=A0A316VI63_9BASI|nr:uncharacterized protein FA14DRAFT_172600 [Meira miltonrushii]PWN36013.1 hypothetical protein FA14DRAFT_172600 [Meira miltonrushii]